MSINDLILLSILSSKNKLPLSEIVKKLRELKLEKFPTRTGIYSRLTIFSTIKLVETSWEEGKKLYKSSDIGKKTVKRFQINLNQLKKNEPKRNQMVSNNFNGN